MTPAVLALATLLLGVGIGFALGVIWVGRCIVFEQESSSDFGGATMKVLTREERGQWKTVASTPAEEPKEILH